MAEHHVHFTSLALVTVLAFAVPLLLGRIRFIRIPVAVGEILAGIIVGRSGLNLIQVDGTLELFNFLGLSCLMFLSGLEIDFAALARGTGEIKGRPAWLTRLHNPLGLGLLLFAASTWGSYLVAQQLQNNGVQVQPLVLALVIATCGLSIIMPVLKDRNMLNQPLGQVLMSAAVLGDFLPMLGLSVVAAMALKGSAMEALLIFVLVAAGIGAYYLGRFGAKRNLLAGLSSGTAQIGVRAAFALMFVLLLLAETVGVEAILGAFIGGLATSMVAGSYRQELTHKLDALGFGFLIPVFFLMVGITFDLSSLLADPGALLVVPLLVAATFIVKGIPTLLLTLWHPIRPTVAGAVLMGTQMSITIASSAVAVKIGAYSNSLHSAVVLGAILSAIIGPVLFNKLMPADDPEAVRRGIIIVGAGPPALLLAQQVQALGETCSIIDKDPTKVEELQASGLQVVREDATTPEGLRAVGGETARALVAMTGNDRINVAAAKVGRSLGIERSVVFARGSEGWREGLAEGFSMLNPDVAPVALAEKMLTSPGAAGLVQGGDIELWDVRLTNPAYVGKSLREIRWPPHVLVVSVQREGQRIVPHGDTRLQDSDLLTFVGPVPAITPVRDLLQGNQA